MTTFKPKVSAALQKRMDAVPLGWLPPNLLGQKEMFRKRFVTDLHGVILDWTASFCSVAKEQYGVNLDPSAIRHYMMGYDIRFPITPAQFASVFSIVVRLKGKDGYGGLPVRPGAVEAFKAIKAAGIKYEVWSWVPGASEHDSETLKAFGTGIAQLGTYEHLVKLGIIDDPVRQIRFVSPAKKAADMAADHVPLIIEDNPVTAVHAGYAYGNACIMTPERYNENLVSPGVLRITDLSELAPAVIDFFEKLEKAGALAGV
jgi:hypothetical protein